MAEPAASESAPVLSQSDLEIWGRGVGEAAAAGNLELPVVVALRGPLGAGKSVLARAIARGAGVTSPMPSPTYNLLFTYGADLAAPSSTGAGDPASDRWITVHHLDLYRLEDPDDVWELGWDELGEGEEIVLIEWPERAESLLPSDRWEVRLGFPSGGRDGDPGAADGSVGDADLRTLVVRSVGDAPDPPRTSGSPGSSGSSGSAPSQAESGGGS